MTFAELIQRRVSVRDYTAQPIEEEKIERILEAARLAPSAHNSQPWRFVVITSEKGRKAIAESYPREWIKTAPVYILVCGNRDEAWVRKSDDKNHLDIDMGIVIEHICLAAAEEELGSCVVCHFDASLCHTLFNLPEHFEPAAIIPIGYPTNPDIFINTPKKRKGISEVVLRETF